MQIITRIRKITIFVLAAMLLVCSGGTSYAADASNARAGIQAAYDGISTAYESHDLDKFMSYFALDYTETDLKGAKLDRTAARKYYQDQLNKIKTMHSRYTFSDPMPVASGDQVEMKMHTDGTGEKRILFARFKGTFTNDLLVKDLWVETPQGWRLKSRQDAAKRHQNSSGLAESRDCSATQASIICRERLTAGGSSGR